MLMEKLVVKVINLIGSVGSLIIHSVFFVLAFAFYFTGTDITKVLLVLTTVVSLEAIYLSILIQLSVNIQSKKLQTIQENVEEIQEDVEELQEEAELNDKDNE